MSAFKPFEIEAIHLMAHTALPAGLTETVLAADTADSYEYTGCGYFLTVKHPLLPQEKKSLSDPPVAGIAGEIQAGFVVYLGDGELTLECHTWGEIYVPADFREMAVTVKTPPDNYIDLRGAA